MKSVKSINTGETRSEECSGISVIHKNRIKV